MALAVFVSEGQVIDYTPGSSVSAGDVVVAGKVVGIAQADIAAGALGALRVQGVHDVAKEASVAHSLGDKLYWDGATKVATKTDGGSFPVLGYCVAAAGASATITRVRLDPSAA